MKIQIGTTYVKFTREEIKSLLNGKSIRIVMDNILTEANVLILTVSDEEGDE